MIERRALFLVVILATFFGVAHQALFRYDGNEWNGKKEVG
ncbi:hypothetical protein BRO54_1049 [Geobacillus proteiniphilus]|uniref:Uncharacterized protein n=1 Tax=Geobacillus proteiniphilus TaxID=860353 RepID=A0A1Q5T4V1_9BACL|nr:hypothetical protein BRO54_1049 [Geobacillus proteiniphilus]